MKKVLITGASGFIGHSLCKSLSKSSISIRGTVRSPNKYLIDNDIEYLPIGDISLKPNWKDALKGIDCVIHCAGKTYDMNSDRESIIITYQM